MLKIFLTLQILGQQILKKYFFCKAVIYLFHVKFSSESNPINLILVNEEMYTLPIVIFGISLFHFLAERNLLYWFSNKYLLQKY